MLKKILTCAMLAAGEPLSIERFLQLFPEENKPDIVEIRETLALLSDELLSQGLTVKEVASGYCIQIDTQLTPYIAKLFEKRPPRYSRALLETLALVAYRQPITRGEIEEIRGVSVSSHIFKILMEREWVRIIGHKDVPGKPALYATTKIFLDYFNLKNLQDLPSLINFTAQYNDETLSADPQVETDHSLDAHLQASDALLPIVTALEKTELENNKEILEETMA